MKPRNNIEFLQQIATIVIRFYEQAQSILSDTELLDYVRQDPKSFHSVIIGILIHDFSISVQDLNTSLHELNTSYDKRFLEGLDLL